jgi:transposase
METETQLCHAIRHAALEPAAAYTTGQVARILGVSAETVRRLVDAYEPIGVGSRPHGPPGLRAVRITTHRRISHQALAEWLEDNAVYLRLYAHA